MVQINHVHCSNWKEDDPNVVGQCEQIIYTYDTEFRDPEVERQLNQIFTGVARVNGMNKSEYREYMFTRHAHVLGDEECRDCRAMDPSFDEVFRHENYGGDPPRRRRPDPGPRGGIPGRSGRR